MYLNSSAPLARNGLDPMPADEVASRRAAVDRMSYQIGRALMADRCVGGPETWASSGPNLVTDVARSQDAMLNETSSQHASDTDTPFAPASAASMAQRTPERAIQRSKALSDAPNVVALSGASTCPVPAKPARVTVTAAPIPMVTAGGHTAYANPPAAAVRPPSTPNDYFPVPQGAPLKTLYVGYPGFSGYVPPWGDSFSGQGAAGAVSGVSDWVKAHPLAVGLIVALGLGCLVSR